MFPSIPVFIRDFPDFAVRNDETKGNFSINLLILTVKFYVHLPVA